jgi:putative peptidoglycan lipid II flippase
MSNPVITASPEPDSNAVDVATAAPAGSFVAHARLIAGLTLVSRILGMARESVSAHFLGAGVVASAFAVAFAVPNLFRKLFGEGALSAAFIPLYAQAVKQHHEADARRFASSSVTLLALLLLAVTLLGELVLLATIFFVPDIRPDRLLTMKLAAVMLPYVILICMTAFLSSVLQVHRRFGAPAAAPILLNLIHIVVLILGARLLHLSAREPDVQLGELLRTRLAFWLGGFVLVAGVGQLVMLVPSLRAIGFRFRPARDFWTPQVKRMLVLSVPVALGAGVLQLSVLMDKGISLVLSQAYDNTGRLLTHFTLLGEVHRYPMEVGATARLTWAQLLYQFPLGVFAIALATAIFPALSADALDADRTRFRSSLRHGIEATMFEGLAASAGLILIRYPLVRLLFEHGSVTPHDTDLIARSLLWYSTAIWAFSLLQIVNRAYYALHDTTTPLVMSILNIAINLVVELPLVWLDALGEAGMAIGTSVSFIVQALVMLWMLDRRLNGIALSQLSAPVGKMLLATVLMVVACVGVTRVPGYPTGASRVESVAQLVVLVGVGAIVYCGACAAMGVGVMDHLLPRRIRRRATSETSES